jgi:hypothetical protein
MNYDEIMDNSETFFLPFYELRRNLHNDREIFVNIAHGSQKTTVL